MEVQALAIGLDVSLSDKCKLRAHIALTHTELQCPACTTKAMTDFR